MNQMYNDAVSVFRQAFEEFEPWKYEVLSVVKDGQTTPALELHFRVPCVPTKGLHGFIDAILRDKETGFVTWVVNLMPNEQKELIVHYRVKYPKNRRLTVE